MSARAVPESALVRGVRWRLLAWSGGTTLAVLVLLGSLIYAAVASSLEAAGVDQLRQRASLLEARLAVTAPPPGFPTAGPPNTVISVDPADPGVAFVGGAQAGTLAYVVGSDNMTVPDVRRVVNTALPDVPGVEAARSNGESIELATIDGTPLRILSRAVPVADATWVVQVVADRIAEERALGVLVTVLAGGGLLVLLASLLAGWLYAERALVPIRDAMRRQRDFAADASHELRTPLSVLKGSVAHLRRHRTSPVGEVGAALDDIDTEVDRVAALVDDLLLLARTDSGTIELSLGPSDLGDVALDAAAGLVTLAAERHIELRVDAEPVPMLADAGRLGQLVRILLDNAIRHAPDGTRIDVSARRIDGSARLLVEDEGPGFRPEDLPRVFDRFYRAAGAPSGGTGLGLAIAAWIVEHHGGRITAENLAGGGARFTATLPAIRPVTPPRTPAG